MFLWIVLITLTVFVFYFIDREIYFYEGTRLGPRAQAWLYDRWAKKYDDGKKESILHDADMLAQPTLEALKEINQPFILDLATGSGRLPFSLLKESSFNGHVIAADVSKGMLSQAAQKLAAYRGRFTLLRVIEFPLPFSDNSFDMAACMEALEVMPEMETPLKELFRVLRPGGFLLTSHATNASGRKTKVITQEQFKALLEYTGFDKIEIVDWWRWFDRGAARKPGQSTPSAHLALTDILQCPSCQKAQLEKTDHGLCCKNCNKTIEVNSEEIVLY
jgi:ubiquinone/menaquinone biosynthesis C-methylase UbiE